MICLLVLEGILVCGLASFYMWRLLQLVSKQRYKLFSVFMGVPTGFVRGLATKQVQLDEEDDVDSDSDGGDDLVVQVWHSGIKQIRVGLGLG